MGQGIVREKPALMTTTDVLTFGDLQQDYIILKSQNNGDQSKPSLHEWHTVINSSQDGQDDDNAYHDDDVGGECKRHWW